MGNLYRFVEPVVLLLPRKKGSSYGYGFSARLQEHALTDAEIERALFRLAEQLGTPPSEFVHRVEAHAAATGTPATAPPSP
jgi:hypothetical protein